MAPNGSILCFALGFGAGRAAIHLKHRSQNRRNFSRWKFSDTQRTRKQRILRIPCPKVSPGSLGQTTSRLEHTWADEKIEKMWKSHPRELRTKEKGTAKQAKKKGIKKK